VTRAAAAAAPSFEACLAAAPPADAPADAPAAALWRLYEPLRAYLAERGGAQPPLAVASVFTTQDPVSELFALAAHLDARPTPAARDVVSQGVTAARVSYEVFRGRYSAPRFQEGELPYQTAGGAIRFDAAGAPITQGEEDLRFSLSVPADDDAPMPEEGWPVALFAHGTGGDYESYLRGDVALTLARQGVAVVSIDQIHHGERDGGACARAADYAQCVSLLFFNFLVPAAGRDNVRQSAVDLISLRKMVSALTIPAARSAEGRAARFNPDRVLFMGHSQGGLNGPLFMAVDPHVRGGVLSGAGSNIAISLEQKVKPFNVNQLIRAALGLPASETLDRWHPALTLLQTFIEPGDSANYGRFWFSEPPAGHPHKSVFMTVGLEDDYTPPETTFALAASGRVPLVQPALVPVEALDFLGVEPASLPPYSGNVAGGRATAGLAQFEGLGHFVVFESASAKERYGNFLRDLATRVVPKVY